MLQDIQGHMTKTSADGAKYPVNWEEGLVYLCRLEEQLIIAEIFISDYRRL